MSCNEARIAAIGFVPALLVLLGAVGWIGSERAIHPAAKHYATTLAAYPDLHPSEIRFQSRTRVAIAATFFPGVRHAVIVLSHGYGDNQAQMLPYAEFLHGAGYSVLTYDMRNRGRSGGEAVTLGALESLDLVSAVEAKGIEARIGTLAGGIILGVTQAIGFRFDAGWGIWFGHIVFLTMLLFRPSGLFPKTQ